MLTLRCPPFSQTDVETIVNSRRRSLLAVAGIVAALVLGAGLGAATFAFLDDGTTTVVRQVTVEGSQPVASGSLSIAEVYDRASKAVVEIRATSGGTFGGQSSAQGSGFVFDRNGDIVTNQHVVAGASTVSVSFWNGTERPARVVGTDPSTDLAVIRVDAPSSLLQPLTPRQLERGPGRRRGARVREPVRAGGNGDERDRERAPP